VEDEQKKVGQAKRLIDEHIKTATKQSKLPSTLAKAAKYTDLKLPEARLDELFQYYQDALLGRQGEDALPTRPVSRQQPRPLQAPLLRPIREEAPLPPTEAQLQWRADADRFIASITNFGDTLLTEAEFFRAIPNIIKLFRSPLLTTTQLYNEYVKKHQLNNPKKKLK
jgi:hypothetical protein